MYCLRLDGTDPPASSTVRTAKKNLDNLSWRGMEDWRRDPESNRARRICNPLHNRFAIAPCRSGLLPCFISTDKKGKRWLPFLNLERDKRLELSTYTLARYRSTN